MACPAPDVLQGLVEAPAGAVSAVREHVASCPRCAAEVEAARRARGHLEVPPPDPRFAARVMERVWGAEGRRRWAPRGWLLVGAPAALVLALAVSVSHHDDATSPVARGGGAGAGRLLGVELRLHRAGARGPGTPASAGDELRPDDGLSAVIHNRSGRTTELCMFAVDEAGAVHWLYPAYTRPGDDPASITVPAAPTVWAPREGVSLEAPAAGRLVVTAVFLGRPVRVSEVEAALARGGLGRLDAALPVQARDSLTLVVPATAARSPR